MNLLLLFIYLTIWDKEKELSKAEFAFGLSRELLDNELQDHKVTEREESPEYECNNEKLSRNTGTM